MSRLVSLLSKGVSQLGSIPTKTHTFSRAFSSLPPQTRRVQRSLLYVPCSEERKIRKSLSVPADCIMYDLEDGVSLNRKGQARELVSNALQLTRDYDAELGLQSKKLQSILIPKVQKPSDIAFVSKMIDSIAPEESRDNIKIIAGIESALGLMNIKEIATCNPRLQALLFASEDYISDVEGIRTKSRREMYFARATVVNAARAYGLDSIDMVCVDYKSKETLIEECQDAVEMGFTGKQAIHPSQIETIHEMFCPSSESVDKAVRIIKGFEENASDGVGAFELDGKMIDMPVVKWAEKVLAKARLSGIDV
ncbi:Citrate lyase subunit beta-like protein, mitochondrial [Smittium mucronatum]|uniref:Citrate lyase subunit beta-like protein, mitochondrial n=1 Tax=Smittium mucronatum TaxID=133383 RepID=A0A1R0H6W1_9FUNG|nr:Citrate lyase subunit beta-like protein, mitochondrial [Smittium mucronatum]